MSGTIMAITLTAAAMAAAPPRPPKDAPFCLAPNSRPVFVAPMGQVFRGEPNGSYPAVRWVASVDADGDGRVSRAEMAADAAAFFRQLDRDGDGRLTPDEVARYENQVAPEITLYAARRDPAPRGRAGMSGGDGDAGYAGPTGAGRFSWLNIPEPVAAADADLDRVVTAAEFAQAADRRFDRLARGDAFLAPAALPRTPQQAALEGPCRPVPARQRRDRDGWDDMEGLNG